MAVFVQKDQIQIAAIAQFQPAELAVGDDGEVVGQLVWRLVTHAQGAGFGLQALPAPACGGFKHGVCQGAQVIGHFFHAQATAQIACQRAEGFGMHGAAQQVEHVFFVVFAGGLQGLQAQRQLVFEGFRLEALLQHGIVGQLVDHAGVANQVAGGPAGQRQNVQHMRVDGGLLQHQRQVALAAQDGFQPVHEAQHAAFLAGIVQAGVCGLCRACGGVAWCLVCLVGRGGKPLHAVVQQLPDQGACLGAQGHDAGVLLPCQQALLQGDATACRGLGGQRSPVGMLIGRSFACRAA